MLANDDINTISVWLPNFLHAPVTIDSLNAGKHVLCEKPPARNAEEAIAMAEAAKANNRTLMYAFVLRFGGDSLTLRKMVDDGMLGDMYFGKAGYVRRRGIPIGAAWSGLVADGESKTDFCLGGNIFQVSPFSAWRDQVWCGRLGVCADPFW